MTKPKPQRPSPPKVRTLDEARDFILEAGVCLLFSESQEGLPSLWEVTALSDKRPARGWSPRVVAIWHWKNELPAQFPEDIFYGKLPGGLAMLMSVEHLRTKHYPQHHVPLPKCSVLARRVYELIRREPRTTAQDRKAMLNPGVVNKSMIDRALTELQTTLNITRTNAPEVETDTWVRFTEQYPEFAE